MSEDKLKSLRNSLDKKYGKGITQLGNERVDVPVWCSTGSLKLDCAIGVGGIPQGRIGEIYGAESCLSGDTFISYDVWSNDGTLRRNCKGGSIKRLYERFNNKKEQHIKQGVHLQNNDSIFYVKSINEDGRVIRNLIADVVKTGVKECFKLKTARGFEIIATKDHKFFCGDSYKPLSVLDIGDKVYIHNNTRFKKKSRKVFKYKEVMVKYHPNGMTKKVDKYVYYRLPKHRLVFEANMNNLSFNEYIKILNTKDKEYINQKFKFISNEYDVHHKDENFFNNNISNLVLIKKSDHYRYHAKKNHNNLRFIVVEDEIVSIEYNGQEETYDIKCFIPYNNYIANGIVVHNSGKTTLTLSIIAESQKVGGYCAFVDMEHSLDPVWASNLGVDMDKLLVSQPSDGESCLDIVREMVESNIFSIIVVDSVSALVPRAELNGEMGDNNIGLQARMMSKAMRILTPVVSKSKCTVLFINQTREKIGVMFGSPETTSGGNALKFAASLRMRVSKDSKENISDDDKGATSVGMKIKIVKNKVAPPFKVCKLDLSTGVDGNFGFNVFSEVVDLAIDFNLIEKAGAWFKLENGEKFQGKVKVESYLKENNDYFLNLKEKVTELVLEQNKPIKGSFNNIDVDATNNKGKIINDPDEE